MGIRIDDIYEKEIDTPQFGKLTVPRKWMHRTMITAGAILCFSGLGVMIDGINKINESSKENYKIDRTYSERVYEIINKPGNKIFWGALGGLAGLVAIFKGARMATKRRELEMYGPYDERDYTTYY